MSLDNWNIGIFVISRFINSSSYESIFSFGIEIQDKQPPKCIDFPPSQQLTPFSQLPRRVLSRSKLSKSSSRLSTPMARCTRSDLSTTSRLSSLVFPSKALSIRRELDQMSGTIRSSFVRVYGGPLPSSPVLTQVVSHPDTIASAVCQPVRRAMSRSLQIVQDRCSAF